jgi:hypothetical protein
MIYINNELLNYNKPEHKQYRKAFDAFRRKFSENFVDGRMVKPLLVKYKEDLVKPDPRNKGLLLQPKSMGLQFRSRIYNEDGQEVEIRYSRTPGIMDHKLGILTFKENFTEVVDGRLSITDPDLALYFSEYSRQNADNPKNQGELSAWFRIDDPVAERKIVAQAKAREALFMSRLWNEPEHGGLGDSRLRVIGAELMIKDSDTVDVNELRENIDRLIKFRPALKDEFLDRTDATDITPEEEHARMVLVAKAIEMKLFSVNTITRTYHKHDPETKKQIKKPIFNYGKNEKNHRLAFYVYLETEEPETIDALKQSMALLTEA